MEQSPFWEANIPGVLCNPKVHHRFQKNSPPVPNLGQINPFHVPIPIPEDTF